MIGTWRRAAAAASGNGSGMGGMGGSTTTTASHEHRAPGIFRIGVPTDYAAMGLHIVTNKGLLIGRDAGGLYALTAICTHEGFPGDMASVERIGPSGRSRAERPSGLHRGPGG